MSRHTLSQTDLQKGERGPGWPSTYEQYSAEVRAEPGEGPRQAHKRLGAFNAAGSVASRTSLTTRGSFRSQTFTGRPLPGRRESMRLFSCPSLCSTNHTLSFVPLRPAPAGSPLSISCHIFPVLQATREKGPAGPFAKPGRRTGCFPDHFEPGPSEGSAGYPKLVTRLDVRVAPRENVELSHTFWLIPSHLTSPSWGTNRWFLQCPPQPSRPPQGPGALSCHLDPETPASTPPPFFTLGYDMCGVSCGKRLRRFRRLPVSMSPCTYIVPMPTQPWPLADTGQSC